MMDSNNASNKALHPGGDTRYWRDENVRNYDFRQSILSEKKEDMLDNIVRIVNYFCKLRSIKQPQILDIGCGPGTPMTLSAHILTGIPGSNLTGVDSSDQMVDAAKGLLVPEYSQRFAGFVGDFNSGKFWIPEIDNEYDFIVSSGTFHYLSDRRRLPFLKEIYDHIKNKGILVFSAANHSGVSEIVEMEHLFRAEFSYGQLDEATRTGNFEDFRKRFEATDKKANINWQSPGIWIDDLRSAGFKGVDIVWHLWLKSIFVAVK